MHRKLTVGCCVLLALTVLGGCKSDGADQTALLTEENEGLRAQLVDRNQAIEEAQADLRDRDMRIAELTRELDAAEQAPPATDPFGGIEGVSGSYAAGEVTASVEGDILFDSGKSTIKDGARRSLDAVIAVLRDSYAGRTIRVAGHTDRDPIRKSGFKSNHHLAFERAYAVREYLVQNGVPASNVYVASHGPDRARGSKQESRRVEIAVVMSGS